MKTILLVEDHPIFRNGLAAALHETCNYERIVEASGGKEALRMLEREPFDLMLLDLNLPDIPGLAVLEALKEREVSPRTLVFSMHAERDYAEKALDLGASGYATKNLPFASIELALQVIAAGEIFIERDILTDLLIPRRPAAQLDPEARKAVEGLSPREREVLRLLLKGATMKEAAQRLCVSLRTAENYQSALYTKLAAHSAVELVMIAMRSGAVEIDAPAFSMS